MILMRETTEESIGAIVLSGPREGEVVLLDPEVVAQAPAADALHAVPLNDALDALNAALERLIASVRTSADDYAEAVRRIERGG